MLKINFSNGTEQFSAGIERLSKILKIVSSASGITLTAVKGERIGVSLKSGFGVIYYNEKHHFYRELSVFVKNASRNDSFDITEDGYFKTVGAMISAISSAPKVETVKKQLDYLAIMGYNMVMLYTEDNFYLDGRPFFGYMQGRYTRDELREMDDYAYEYGIEMIACLECYGHMQKYLYWPEAKDIMDTPTVLLAGEEKTFEFVEQLIAEASCCFRSRRIHIGMDEAWNMGRGHYLTKHGYVPPFEIFNDYMQRLKQITDKYGLSPMMWSDMYIRIASNIGWPYDTDAEISEELKSKVPEGMDLVFWHYGEDPGCDMKMLEKYKQFDRNVIMATGLWDWSTQLPDNKYAFESTEYSLKASRANGVREMMTTRWGAHDMFTTMLGFYFTAELCYCPDLTESDVKEGFDAISGGAYEAYKVMSQYNNIFDGEHNYEPYSNRFMGQHLFYQDVMEGLYDSHLFESPKSEHYKKMAKMLEGYSCDFDDTVKRARLLFEVMFRKCSIAERLHPAYNSGDRDTLADISNELPAYTEALTELYNFEFELYMKLYKQANWTFYDKVYGHLITRSKTAKKLIDLYLSGEISEIESLSEKRLKLDPTGFSRFSKVAFAIPEL